MSDMAQWLASLNLEQYAEAFENDAIEIDLLPELTDDDLKALGVNALVRYPGPANDPKSIAFR